jgi:hypothetical protein
MEDKVLIGKYYAAAENNKIVAGSSHVKVLFLQ